MMVITEAGITTDITSLEANSRDRSPTPSWIRMFVSPKYVPDSWGINLLKAQFVAGNRDKEKIRLINPAASKEPPHQRRKSFRERTAKIVIKKRKTSGITGLHKIVVLILRRFRIVSGMTP
jgi:hypothetical protein